MNNALLIYLTAFVATLAVLIAGGAALIGFRRAADDAQRRGDEYERQRARLPDATRLEDLKERVGDAEQRLDDLREDLADAQVLIDQKRAAEAWLEKHRDELHALEANIEQIEKVKAELAARRDELKTLDERADTCRKDADAAEFRRDRMNEEIESIESKLGHAQQLLNSIEQRINDAAAKESAQSAKLATLEQRIEQRKEEAQEQAGELQRLEGRVDETRTQLREVEAAYESAKAALKGLENQEAALRDSIATLKAMHERTLEELRRDGRAQGEEAHAELWQPVLVPRVTRRNSLSQEAKAIEAVGEYLDALGLHFSRRTLLALHTSLKVAEQSPLTVLAGVSGTGKSELPRRYAEAMGIHFLPLPVQPRWDSPQDMFGFYNYLEGRYRPTELTRALIQMDRFGAEEGRGWALRNGSREIYQPLEDQMLLVLLDEMNLARVEYYFSDLLSKLETRRGVVRDDPDQRCKAELALEVGRHFGVNMNGDGKNSQEHDAIMRLFVDTNVLFVGTMNEDESTQTLSDKVMDRANVLRFGKPKQLRIEREGRINGDVSVDVGPLSYKTWLNWIRPEDDLSGSVGKSVDDWIHRLNEAMSRIGRPFAYRVNRAIRSYVANYPDQGEEAAKHAMADQIELRILPKFRGLDPNEGMVNEALGQVQQVLQNLDDEDLHQAVEDSRRAHEHQFVWQGLDRSETGE